MLVRACALAAAAAVAACSAPPAPVGPAAAGPRRITIVATTDLHGHVEAL
ncbi:MAG: RND transporter, partial [Deltaproteobacteria bacterium]